MDLLDLVGRARSALTTLFDAWGQAGLALAGAQAGMPALHGLALGVLLLLF